jgi:hypothetical protein
MAHTTGSKMLAASPREGSRVDFIERYFGISPDGGDGLLEWLLIVLLVLIIITIWLHLPITGKTKAH